MPKNYYYNHKKSISFLVELAASTSDPLIHLSSTNLEVRCHPKCQIGSICHTINYSNSIKMKDAKQRSRLAYRKTFFMEHFCKGPLPTLS